MGVDGIVTAVAVEGKSFECGLNSDCVLSLVDDGVSLFADSIAVVTNALIDSSSGTTGSTVAGFWDLGPHRRFLGSAAGILTGVTFGLDSTEAGSANDEAGID